jgi:hypothetical protein
MMEQNGLPEKIGEVIGAIISLSCFAMLLYAVVIAF